MNLKYGVILACFAFLTGSAVARDWSIGVENVLDYKEFMVSDDVPGPDDVNEWLGSDQMWGEHDDGWAGHSADYLIQKNSENVDNNSLTLTLSVPNGNYDITMDGVYWHTRIFGPPDAKLITAWAEGVDISYSELNIYEGWDWPQIPLGIDIEVTDGLLEITLGNAYSSGYYPGNWFSFEGFRITRVFVPPPDANELSRGHKILLEKGFQLAAWVTGAAAMDMARFLESNFTCVDKWRDTNINPIPAWENAGLFWARGTGSPSTNPSSPYYLLDKELPYVPSLLILRWMDEEFVDRNESPETNWHPRLNQVTKYMARAHQLYPGVLIQSTQWNEQFDLAGLQTFMESAKPDMLAFDMYSYGSGVTVYDLKGMYQELEKYRYAASRGHDWAWPANTRPIPWSLIFDGFQRRSSGYIKSESSIRHNHFSAWTFGAKCGQWWFYNADSSLWNSGHGSFLFHGTGDQNPRQPTFDQVAETNRQSRNLGRSLVSLKSTDARFVKGQHLGGVLWLWQDDKWGEHPHGSLNHDDVPYLAQRNDEDVDSNPLKLSLAVPNGSYEITMTDVYLHGAKDFGDGNYLVTASAEDIDISVEEWNGGVNRTIDVPLAIGPNAVEVTDGQLEITLGNCYSNHKKLGNWFSFEGFQITGFGNLHYSNFDLSYNPPGLESGPVDNDRPANVPAWDANADPYITAISATNLGSTNGGYRGDVIVGYFEPLLESFDGPDYEGEVYFMVLNGLIDPCSTISIIQTQQQIHMEFDFGDSGVTSLLRLSRDTGNVELVPLVHDAGSVYHLDFPLDGGTADLFKFNTGARFVVARPYDFDRNRVVNMLDLQVLVDYWLFEGCGGLADWQWCEGADLDFSTTVDAADLAIFADYWDK